MRKVLHIFPSTAVVDAFHRRILERKGVLFGTAAVTLKRLAGEIAALSSRARRPLSIAGRRLVLEEIVKTRYSGGEGVFAAHRNFPGFPGALAGFIGEAKQALIDADRFAEVAGRIPDAERLVELARLYGLYERALAERKVADGHDMELDALCHLRSGGSLPPLFDDVARIRCVAIHDFTPLQFALLTELSRSMPVEIVMPYDFGRTWLFSHISRTAAAIEALDDTDLNLELKFVDPEGTFLAPLLETVFGGPGNGQLPEGVDLPAVISAPGMYAECEEIGRRIRAMMENGTDPADIAVLFRGTGDHSAMMEDVCRRYSIPVTYRRGVPLRTSSLIRTIMAPFDIISARFGREELFGLLNSSYFHPLRDRSGNFLPADSLEELLIAASYIDESVDPLQSRVGKWIAARKKRGLSCENEEGMLRALGELAKEIDGFANDMTVGGFVLRLEKFIERHSIYERGIEALDNRALKRDASAIMGFQKVLRDLETDINVLGMADKVFTPAGFSSLLKQAMDGEFLAGERTTGVTIMNFHDSRGLSFDHVFIGGLNEGICPAGRIGHPLFKDAEKREFNRIAGKRCFTPAAEKTGEEPLLFCLAVGCAEKSLTFAYSYADSGGNCMLRSPFLDEIAEKLALEDIRIPAGKVTGEPEECLEREELLNSLAARGIFAVSPGDDSAPIGDSLRLIAANSEIEARREAFFMEEDMGRRAALSTPYTGTIRREDMLSEIRAFYESPEGSTFAPTSLEEYGCCPFRYFLKRLVVLAPVEKPDMELEVKDEGTLVHEILRAFYQRMKAEGRLPLAGAAGEKEVLQEEADRVFARWEAEKYTGERLLWEIEKKRVRLILQALIACEAAEEGGFVPDAFEFAFEPLEVESEDGSKIRLRGKIDRMDVDRAAGAVRIVDYKMASNRQKYAELLKKDRMGDTSFQMPVYLLAASEAMKREFGISCQRMFARYWLLRKVINLDKELGGSGKEDFTGFFATGVEERRILGEDNFLNRLCAKVENMKSGDFQITPRECEFCDFAAVCRYVEVGLKEEE
jgi:ATP-dependent helicase/nuclease subunit B